MKFSTLQKDKLDNAIRPQIKKKTDDFLRVKRLIEQLQPAARLQENKVRLNQIEKAIENSIKRILTDTKRRFETRQFAKNITFFALREIAKKKNNLEALYSHMASLNPKTLLKKGYSILFSQKTGSVISSVNELQQGDAIRLMLSDGTAEGTITNTQPTT